MPKSGYHSNEAVAAVITVGLRHSAVEAPISATREPNLLTSSTKEFNADFKNLSLGTHQWFQ